MNISSNLLTAIVSGMILVTGALTNGFWVYKTAQQKNNNDFSIATADSIRKDNERLAKRVDETGKENVELKAELLAAAADAKAQNAAREKAEGERDTLRAACEIFGALFEELVAGRPPSAGKLERLTTRLLDVGYVFRS